MLHMGMGLLDRETGELRYFTEGREDSLAMSIVAPDGSIYVAHSPIRRAAGKAMYPELTPDLTGGIARYKPIRLDLLARDGDMTAEDAGTLGNLLEQSAANLNGLGSQTAPSPIPINRMCNKHHFDV